MNYPKVTVGVPVYNSSNFIVPTLESINNQSYPNIEIIVLDDCSEDDSFRKIQDWKIKSKFPIRVLKNESNLGLSKCSSILLRNAGGKYFQKLDSDDLIYEKKIEEQVTLLESESKGNTGFIFSKVDLINEEGLLIKEKYFEKINFLRDVPEERSDLLKILLRKNIIPNPSVLILTEAIKSVGGYDENLFFEDWDIWIRLTLKYNFLFQKIETCAYRIRANSMENSSKTKLKRTETKIQMFQKYVHNDIPFQTLVLKTLCEMIIYSYFIGDKCVQKKMKWYLAHKFDLKILIYFFMVKIGIPHPSKFLHGLSKNT